MKQRVFAVVASLALVAAVAGGAPQAAPAGAQGTDRFYREAVLSNAAVVSADAQSAGAAGWAPATLAAFQLACTEDSGTATLDVAIQRSVDGGASWASLTTFTQISATGGQTVVYADVRTASAQMIGDRLRVSYDITGTGQYTCTVAAAAEA